MAKKLELDLLSKFKKDYIEKNPKFIDFVFFSSSLRLLTKEQIKNHINNIIES